jgi:hypothetical protein
LTQILLQGVAVKRREVVNPRILLKDIGLSEELVESLVRPRSDSPEHVIMEEMFQHYEELDASFRQAAAADDKALIEAEYDDDKK